MYLAHPLTEHGSLPVSPLTAAIIGVFVVAVAGYWRRGAKEMGPPPEGPFHSWEGELPGTARLTRIAAVALLVLAVVAGRWGDEFQLENLAPALVIGAAWPLLLVAGLVAGPVWRWLDPWDGIARLAAADPGGAPEDVRWAALPAFAWVAFVGASVDPFDPRAIGAALAIYSIATIAGCLILGRISYLGRAEFFGLLFGWAALVPRAALWRWRPPAGTALVLGVLAGGLLFGALRRSELWGSNTSDRATLYAAGGVLAASVLGGLLMDGLEQWGARRAPAGTVAVALVPSVAALAVALALANNVFFTSLQLLPGLLGDPFGFGWDLFGEATRGLDPAPLGARGLVLAQLGVLLAGHVWGAYAAAVRADADARLPVTLGLCVTVGAGTVAVMAG